MWNAHPIEFKNQRIILRELTIGQAIEIAKIPQSMNEARLTSFIGFVCGDSDLALSLTAQERYVILLTYLSLADNDYVVNLEHDDYFTKPLHQPDPVIIDGISIHHLTGQMAMALEQKCENIYDWLTGQMACQMSGDLGALIGVRDMVWGRIDVSDLDDQIQQRFIELGNLTQTQFEGLVACYTQGAEKLKHGVVLGLDNDGIILLPTGGDGQQAARFCADGCFESTVQLFEPYLAQ